MIKITGDGTSPHFFSLEEVEVGDRLMTTFRHNGSLVSKIPVYSPVTVTKVTKTRITTSDGDQWWRITKRRFGTTLWDRKELMIYDEALIQDSIKEQKRKDLIYALSHFKWEDLTLEEAKEAYSFCRTIFQKKPTQQPAGEQP